MQTVTRFTSAVSAASFALVPARVSVPAPVSSSASAPPAPLANPVPAPQAAGATSPPLTAQDALKQIAAQADTLVRLRDEGVDLAKKTFMSKLLGVGMSAVFTAVALAVTVATGGAAAPVMAVAALRFISVASDAACAFQCWRDAVNGIPPERSLPMRASGVGNLIYFAAKRWGKDHDAAVRLATRGSAAVAVSLAVTGAVVGALGPASTAAEKACRVAAGVLLTAQFPADSRLMAQGARLRTSLEALTPLIEAYVQAAGQNPDLNAVMTALTDNGRIELGLLQDQASALARRIVGSAHRASVKPAVSNETVTRGSRTSVVLTTTEGWLMSCLALAKAVG